MLAERCVHNSAVFLSLSQLRVILRVWPAPVHGNVVFGVVFVLFIQELVCGSGVCNGRFLL